MKTVTIKSLSRTINYDTLEKTVVLVDGVEIGGGSYGGEPEDNCRYRDYSWVEMLIKRLAETLDAKVLIEVSEMEEED